MDKSLIHGHEYHHGEELGDLARSLHEDSKYKERVEQARQDAYSKRGSGEGKFEAQGHKYRMTYKDGRYEIERDHY